MSSAYVYCADLYCAPCAEGIMASNRKPEGEEGLDYGSDDYPCGPYADGGGEADSVQHCAECGELLENPLTEEGLESLRDMLAETDGLAVRYVATGELRHTIEDLQHRCRLAIEYRETYSGDLRHGT